MGTWPRHIYRFDRQQDKAFVNDILLGADFIDCINKRVQVFPHSCNRTSIEDVELGALLEFRGIHKNLERGKCLTLTVGWVDRPALKHKGKRKSEGHWIVDSSSGGGGGRDSVFNNGVDLQLCIMERLVDMRAGARTKNFR